MSFYNNTYFNTSPYGSNADLLKKKIPDVVVNSLEIQGMERNTRVYYRGEKLFTLDNAPYTGTDTFITEVLRAFNILKSENIGQTLLSFIENRIIDLNDVEQKVIIAPTLNYAPELKRLTAWEKTNKKRKNGEELSTANAFRSFSDGIDDSKKGVITKDAGEKRKGTGKGVGGIIFWEPKGTSEARDIHNNTRSADHDFISLGHEMAHAYQALRGEANKQNSKKGGHEVIRDYLKYTEVYASHIENIIRAEHCVPLRKYYRMNGSGRLLKLSNFTSRFYNKVLDDQSEVDFNYLEFPHSLNNFRLKPGF